MQFKLFEFRCASWWTPCTRNRFPRIATSSEKVSLAQLFYSVHMFSYNIAQHISIVISTRILSSSLQPPDQLAIKLLHKLRKIKNKCGVLEAMNCLFGGVEGGQIFQIEIRI
jgi:hypothetical protein